MNTRELASLQGSLRLSHHKRPRGKKRLSVKDLFRNRTQRATHVKPGSESGYEPGQSSASDISTIGKNDKRFEKAQIKKGNH